ncbi:MAG: hypothetical protein KTR30_25780 [Saprospiraceae bacterium]|nr:hypothetical protein [Saprospiraceae bacterium]
MKNYFLLFLTLAFSVNSLTGQKIKYKKGMIMKDKEAIYKIHRTKKGGLATYGSFELRTLDDKILLELVDTDINYESLPSEKGKRKAFGCYKLTFNEIGKTALIEHISTLSVPKYLVKQLESMDFYNDGILDDSKFNTFTAEHGQDKIQDLLVGVDSVNIIRKTNSQLMKETFAPLQTREPANIALFSGGAIKDGAITVGKLIASKKGSYATTYRVENREGYNIAKVAIMPGDRKGNVRTMADEKLRWFYHKGEWDMEKFQERILEYLIIYGYL